MGPKIRRQRLRLGLTQDELAGRARISKPYLSLIETGRVANPPRDEKLRQLEKALGLTSGELVRQAHFHRTPQDVRAMLEELSSRKRRPREVSQAAAGGAVVVASVGPAVSTELNPAAALLDALVGWPDISDSGAYAARVSDDSMSPEYRPGEIVVFSPAQPVRGGDDCFVRLTDGRTTFHRVFFETGAAGAKVVRLQPCNPRHRAAIVPAEEVESMHKAVFKYQPVGST
jgi:transcriptional regulator with XRE-family HTH domain